MPRLLAILLAALPLAAAAELEPARVTDAELARIAPDVHDERERYEELQRIVEDALEAGEWAYAARVAAALEASPCATAAAPLLHGRALLKLGLAAAAADAARRSLASLELAAGRFLLARALHAIGDLEGAEREARRAVELDRRDPRLRWEHALVLADLGRYEEAVAIAREATTEDPAWSQARAMVAKWSVQARRPRPVRAR